MTLVARSLLRMGLESACSFAGIIEAFTPTAESRLLWRELQNKLEAFTCFSYPDQASTSSKDDYRQLWMVEGLGYLRGELAIRNQGHGESLIPLHTGMGLAFARRSLEIASCPAEQIAMFLELCDHHALPAYRAACYEALGLVARNLYPERIQLLAHNLPQNLRNVFWHGVGRGLYFLTSNLLPLARSPWPSLQMAESEPPDQIGRLNAIAGLTWAITLVNIRHPEILDLFLRCHGARLPESACQNGIRSARLVWEYSAKSSPPANVFPERWFQYEE